MCFSDLCFVLFFVKLADGLRTYPNRIKCAHRRLPPPSSAAFSRGHHDVSGGQPALCAGQVSSSMEASPCFMYEAADLLT